MYIFFFWGDNDNKVDKHTIYNGNLQDRICSNVFIKLTIIHRRY